MGEDHSEKSHGFTARDHGMGGWGGGVGNGGERDRLDLRLPPPFTGRWLWFRPRTLLHLVQGLSSTIINDRDSLTVCTVFVEVKSTLKKKFRRN